MRLDALKQYASLRQQLLDEKNRLQDRLNQINQVLGLERVSPSNAAQGPLMGRRGRKPAGGNQMTLREAVLKALSTGPIARKDLVQAVQNIGYVFSTTNPLNSIGAILYGKNTPVRSMHGRFFVQGSIPSESRNNGGSAHTGRRKRRHMSAEARARIAAAQRARWAKRKAA